MFRTKDDDIQAAWDAFKFEKIKPAKRFVKGSLVQRELSKPQVLTEGLQLMYRKKQAFALTFKTFLRAGAKPYPTAKSNLTEIFLLTHRKEKPLYDVFRKRKNRAFQ